MSVVLYARSSSMGTNKICPHRGMIEYMLSKKPPSNALELYGELDYMRAEKAAAKGSAVHKALEIIAKRKKNQQDGIKNFYDDELKQTYYSNKLDIKQLIEDCIAHYKNDSQLEWTNWDHINVRNWTWKVLKSDWHPGKVNVYDVEKFFDLELKEDWAKYRYEIGGEILEGYYRVRGTMDLIVDLGNKTLSIRDWKTGIPKEYSKEGQPVKTYTDLCNDSQFLLYYYIGHQLYPGYEIIVEVNHIKERGVSTLFMDEESYKKGYDNLVKYFDSIRNNYPPTLVKYKNSEPCGFCPWASLREQDPSMNDCEFFEREAKNHSAEELIIRYGSISAMSKYSGGGAERDLSKSD